MLLQMRYRCICMDLIIEKAETIAGEEKMLESSILLIFHSIFKILLQDQ